MPASHRVVVVGAGINGLVAAHYLRRAGSAVTMLERAERPGGACVSEVAIVNGHEQRYALGASVLGLMPDFIFRETGLADRLETFVPDHAKRVYFPDPKASAWIHRDPVELERELRTKWGEQGDVSGFRHDEARVVAWLQEGYRTATPPELATARDRLGETLTRLWITGSAAELLHHYFTAERTKIYMGMTVTESGPVSLHEPYSAFTLPVMDSGSVFDGYYGFVREGIWRVTEELARINHEIGVDLRLGCRVEQVSPEDGSLRYSQGGQTRALEFDRLVLAVFVVELLLRFFVYRGRFFRDPWRVFDFVVVGIAVVPAGSAFAVLRSLRVLRVLRLVSLVPSMRRVVGALLQALPGMASIVGLMGLVLYVSAVMATKLFGPIAPEHFGDLGASLFTLFQVMTVEGWPDIARGVMAQSPLSWIFFVVYLLVATFMVLNLFIAVVVNAMQSQVTEDLKQEGETHTRLVLDEVRALRREIEALRGPSRT